MEIQDCVEVSLTTTRSEHFKGAGKWLDSEEIDDRFKGRPAQADAVRRDARKMFDTDRECDLWEVFDYESAHSSGTQEQEIRERQATVDMSVRPKAKARPKREAAGAAAAADGEEEQE
eukprot:6262784-Pyramimonas_sp.AAC.1